jgi:VWFA-related protein
MQFNRLSLATACAVALFAGFATMRPNATAQQGAGSSGATVQQSAPPPSGITLKVTSRETVVDVSVTDANGNPVHGLQQSDFTVKEDGKPQPIRSFHEFVSEAVPEPEKLPPNIYTNQQPPPVSGAVNVFLLDFLNSAPDVPPDVNPGPGLVRLGGVGGLTTLGIVLQWQHLMKVDAIKYLQSMPTGTRVALLGMFQPGSLHVLQGITSDPALLSAAVDATHYGTQSIASTFESWCAQQESRNRSTLESFTQIAADLAAIKGRKNLIWFTVGLATITDAAQRPSCLTDYSKDLQKAYALLAAAQISVFPVSVRGVGVGAAELSMESLAEATGGTAFYNNNDLVPFISKAIASGSDYYTLTYIPPGTKYDGRHHTIHLDADKPGLHLTYRDNYYAEDPTKMAPTVGLTLTTTPPEVHAGNMQAAMSRSMPTSADLLFYVRIESSSEPAKPSDPQILGTLDPSFKDKPLTRYGFHYAIPARKIALSAGPNGSHNGSVELDLAAYDTDGKLVTSLSQTVTMSLNDKTVANNEPLNFSQQIDLPAGQLFVRVGVLDPASNKVGTLELPLKVEKK